MARKGGLGKGLDALIPGGEVIDPQGTTFISIDKIVPNPFQPRLQMDPSGLEELAASIREHGVLQPLLVSPGKNPGEYTLIAGERRLVASRLAGLDQVPVILREADDRERSGTCADREYPAQRSWSTRKQQRPITSWQRISVFPMRKSPIRLARAGSR